MDTVWVTITELRSGQVMYRAGFDTDDNSLGQAVGTIDGFALGKSLHKIDASANGVEQYHLATHGGIVRYTATVV